MAGERHRVVTVSITHIMGQTALRHLKPVVGFLEVNRASHLPNRITWWPTAPRSNGSLQPYVCLLSAVILSPP